MTDEFEEEERPLVLRYEGPEKTPLVWVHLDVAGGTQIVPAIVRPDLPITVIASQWAEGLGLSRGAAVLAQIATGGDDTAEQWGPCEYITPEVSEALDGEIREDAVGGLLLGQDFLQAIIVNLLGPARLMVLLTPTE
jgi:hypothetical protein